MRLVIIFLVSGAARIWFALHTVFAGDELAVYHAAARFYITGHPATTGARIVYTGTVLPGMAQDLVAGLPLFLTGGWPWLTVVVIALLQTGAAWLLWDAYRRLFPKLDATMLAAFFAFAPWTYMYSGFVNTSYLAPLCILVFWGWIRVLQGSHRGPALALGFGLTAAIQFNLAATFLFAWIGLTAAVLGLGPLKKKIRAALPAIALGLALGALGVLPYFFENTHTAESGPLSKNLHFDLNHVQDLYKVFFRFLSFPTGETTRFLGMHRGFGGALEKMSAAPLLLATGVPALLSALVLMGFGLRFFLRRTLWRNLFKLKWGIPELIAAGPLLMMGLFMISIKEPSAHALLPFLPLSFFPLLTEWPKRSKPWILPAISGVGLLFSVGGYMESYRPSLLEVQRAAQCAVSRELKQECTPSEAQALASVDAEIVQSLVRTTRSNRSESLRTSE